MGPLLFFIKTRRPRQFNFTPRYYDEIKERHEKRMAKIESERLRESQEDAPYIPNIKGQFSKSMRQGHLELARTKQRSNMRLILILAVLIGAAYFLFFKDTPIL